MAEGLNNPDAEALAYFERERGKPLSILTGRYVTH
jgi:hypothetical protein